MTHSQNFFSKLRNFDAYPKTLTEIRIKTQSGAIISLISALLITCLILNEISLYFTVHIENEIFVDTSRSEKMDIHIDILLNHIPCMFISVDAMDASGEQQLDVVSQLLKRRVDREGNFIDTGEKQNFLNGSIETVKVDVDPIKSPSNASSNSDQPSTHCGSCYGAEDVDYPCCKSCDEVQLAYARKGWDFTNPENIEQCKKEGWLGIFDKFATNSEGCNVYGTLRVNRVAGNFHIAPGKSFTVNNAHVHSLSSFQGHKFDTSHYIKKLSFGEEFPGKVNPLNGRNETTSQPGVMFQYFVKVVPTTYYPFMAPPESTNQYSTTLHARAVTQQVGNQGLPGVFFLYDISPMMVVVREEKKSFLHFITNLCAIIGGVYTIASILDSFIYHSINSFRYKMQVGKVI